MIITLTSNPSIDYYIEMPGDPTSGVQRASSSYFLAGGKGINVSLILNQLGIPSVSALFLGGFTGGWIREQMKQYPQVRLSVVEIDGDSRINVKIRGRRETDINTSGPLVTEAHQQELLEKLKVLWENDWLMVCGSLAKGMDPSFLLRAAKIAQERRARLVLDVAGIPADLIARCRPALVKPNVEELCDMFGCRREDAVPGELARRLLELGVGSILLSDGGQGAFYYVPGKTWQVTHPTLEAVSTVGSGDSMLAAFVGRLDRGDPVEEALTWAAAAGEATAVSKGLACIEQIEALRSSVHVEVIPTL